MIIGLSSYATGGKDTVAKFIQELQPEQNWQVKKFSGKLKAIASLLTAIPAEKFEDQEFKQSNLSEEWSTIQRKPGKRQDGIFSKITDMEIVPTSVREFLQKLGTDAVRDGLHKNAWVNALMADYKATVVNPVKFGGTAIGEYPNWIVTDCRFFNEAKAIKDKGGVIIRIDRPGVKPVNAHPSETALDDWNFDYKIANASDLVALKQSVEVLLNKL